MDAAQVARLKDVLERWEDQLVAVRILAPTDDLVTAFTGILGTRSGAQHPPLFWPIECGDLPDRVVERRGIYVDPELLGDVRVHVGGFVVEYAQAGVTVNLRRLDAVAR